MKKVNFAIWPLVWLLSIPLCVYSADGTNIEEKNKSAVKRYTYEGGAVEATLKKPKKGEPVDMAYEFLELNKEVFRMKDPRNDMVLKEVKTFSKVTRVTLKQVYRGIPVDAGARIWFKNDGPIEDFKITYYDDIDLSPTPSIDSATAENLAVKDLGSPENAKVFKNEQYSTHLTIWRDNDGKLHLIWVLFVKQEYPESRFWEYYIDAHEGTTLSKRDIDIYDRFPLLK